MKKLSGKMINMVDCEFRRERYGSVPGDPAIIRKCRVTGKDCIDCNLSDNCNYNQGCKNVQFNKALVKFVGEFFEGAKKKRELLGGSVNGQK